MSTSMKILTATLCMAGAAVLVPLWLPLLLAAWCADLLRSPARRLELVLGGRRRAATAIVVLLLVGTLLPLGGMVAALVSGVRDLLDQVRAAFEGQGSLAGVLLGGGVSGPHPVARDWADLASRFGANVWAALNSIARASASAVVRVLVFVAAVYSFTVEGEHAYGWLERNAPIPPEALSRLAGAFRETGRGLIVAGGGTALLQGTVATVAYMAIGIPRALLLGLLTALCALVPVVGTGLVWIPLAIELGATGQYWRAVVVTVVGVGIHSLVDNFARPVLARYGRLTLPTFVVLVSMIGGVAMFGAAGALLGPLVIRLSVEALAIISEMRAGTPARQVAAATSVDARRRTASTEHGAERASLPTRER